MADFYRRQLSIPAIRRIIGEQDTFLRLFWAMRAYVIRMFEGNYDLTYANSRLRVGQVHARIGVAPKLYVSSLHMLEELAQERIGAGGCEALYKLFPLDLQFAFDAYIDGLVSEVAQARDEIQRNSDTLEEVARERTAEATRHAETDAPSALRSRMEFDVDLQRQWEIATATAVRLTVAIFDLDHFKTNNNTKGHLAGDRVIQVVGQVMTREKRATDLAFRIGGDKFCMVFPATDLEDALGVCDRLCDRIGESLGGEVTLSYGLASLRERAAEMPKELISKANRALT